jgi:hypothetical protein
MAWFYVKQSLGTRTTGGGYGSQQTGTFAALGAANVYATITDAISDGAGSGDYINVSDAHSYSTSSAITYTGPTTTNAAALIIVTVEDANCDTETTASAYQEWVTGGTNDITINGFIHWRGVYLKSDDDITQSTETGLVSFVGGDMELTGAGDGINMTSSTDSGYLQLKDTTITGDAGSIIAVSRGGLIEMDNVTTVGITGSSGLFFGHTAGGSSIYAKGCDFSTVTGTLIAQFGDGAQRDTTNIYIQGCRIGSGCVITDTANTVKPGLSCTVTNTSDTSAGAEYQYYHQSWGGQVEDDTAFYRDGSTAFPSGQKVSYKCVTNANCFPGKAFVFDLPTRFAELSNAASDVLTIHLLSATSLNDDDVWLELSYPDGTNKHLYNRLSTEPASIFSTPTGLTTTTEAWTGRTTENRYKIDLDTSSDAGADSVPIIRAYVTLASTTIYFCSTPEVS